jgi:hypothetical protein
MKSKIRVKQSEVTEQVFLSFSRQIMFFFSNTDDTRNGRSILDRKQKQRLHRCK